MPTVTWTDDYNCGVAAIDHEHRELLDVINSLLGRMSENITDDEVAYFLGEIHGQIESHFALEEKLMRDAAYPNYGPHKADHDRLLDEIRDIMEEAASASHDDAGDALAQRLGAWFSDHFRTMDRDLHKLAGL